MKPTQLPLVKLILEQMLSGAREVTKKTATEHIPVIQRVTEINGVKYVQLITTVGIVSIKDSGKLTDTEYSVLDIGSPSKWGKVSKGVITASEATQVPIKTACDVAAFADPELINVDTLLDSTEVLPPVSSMLTPGRMSVFLTANSGKSATWAYDPVETDYQKSNNYLGMRSEWTRNPIAGPDIYGIVRAWNRAVVYAFPKNESGSPDKIDGVALSRIANRSGLRIVSRDLGIVVTMVCSHFPQQREISYYDMQGNLLRYVCEEDGSYTQPITNKENTNMHINMVDVSAMSTHAPTQAALPKEDPKPQITIEATPAPVTSPVPQPPPQVAPPVAEVTPTDTVAAAAPVANATKSEEPLKNTEEVLQDALNTLSELFEMQKQVNTHIKGCQAIIKSAIKTYKTELKDIKSNVKENEELVKARAALKRLKSLIADADV